MDGLKAGEGGGSSEPLRACSFYGAYIATSDWWVVMPAIEALGIIIGTNRQGARQSTLAKNSCDARRLYELRCAEQMALCVQILLGASKPLACVIGPGD